MEAQQRFYAGKRILVTGGAGFIGSHLVEKLVTLGARVTVLDNFTTGSLNNLKAIVHNINIMYADVRSTYSCLRATLNQDIVFHLAALISVPESVKNPALCYAINVDGTKNILDACKKNVISTVVYSSSSAVYGTNNGVCSETDEPCPQSPYAISKYRGEQLCKQFTRDHGMNTAILRYFNVYGERQNPNGPYAAVRSKFAQLLRTSQPLTIYGDGKQTRDFIHISPVVEANLAAGMCSTLYGEIFNVASGTSMNLLDLITQLEKEMGNRHVSIVFQPTRLGDIEHSQAKTEKLQQLLQNSLSQNAPTIWQQTQKTATL
ncbi:MAG: NAD-dependent epimerase/dehydratase family protein [Candidatus Babeliales bacterium]